MQFLEVQTLNVLTYSIASTFMVSAKPSKRLQTILDDLKVKPVLALEAVQGHNQTEQPIFATSVASVKQILNSFSGVYICVNLNTGKVYVGSAIIGRMYRRFSAHLLNGKGGSMLVKRAIMKYGIVPH